MINKFEGKKKSGKSSSAAKEDPNTLTTNTIVKAIFLFSEGPVEGLSTNDGKSIYFDDVPLIDPDGNENHAGVGWTFRNGDPDQTAIPGIPSGSSITNVNTKVLFATPVVQSITGSYDAVNVTISIPALTQADTTTGVLKSTDLAYAIDVKTASGSYVTVHDIQLNQQKTTTEWRASYRVDLPEGGSPWSVRVRRLTADSSSVNIQNDLYFASYTTMFDSKFTYRNSCVMGLSLPAKEFQGQIPSIKAKIKGIKCWIPKNYDPTTRVYATSGTGTSGGIWDGSFKAAWTDNPVWIFYDLLINNRYGLGQDFNPDDDPDSNMIDKWSLYPIAQFCDGMVSDGYGGQEARYRINTQITDKQEAYDLLQTILSTLNGMIYFSAESLYAVADMPMAIDDIFTQADVVEGLFEYSGTALKTRHSAVVCYYNDPLQLYKRAAVVYEDSELIDQIGYRSIEINNFGCTSRAQALRTAKWLLHTEKMQTQTVTFKTGHKGGFLTPGNLIKIFDDYKAGVRMGGRILSAVSGSGGLAAVMEVDQEIDVAVGDTILYINGDGELITATAAFAQSGTQLISNGTVLPVEGAPWAIVKPAIDGQLFKIIHIQEDETETYTVIALQHDEGKFDIIDADVVLGQGPTSIYGVGKLPKPTDIVVEQWWETVSGTEPFPHITVSWLKPSDNRITGFQLELKTPTEGYNQVYDGAATTWDSARLASTNANDYSVRVRCYDALGRYSDWAYNSEFGVPGKDVAPDPPSNVTVTNIIGGFTVNWDNYAGPDFKHTEVYVGTTTVQVDAAHVSDASDDFYVQQGLNAGDIRYVWLRTVSHAKTNQYSTYAGPYTATAKGVQISDFDDEVTGIPIVDVLPDPTGYVGPPIVFLTTDQKLYTYKAGAWTLTVAEVDPDFNPGIPGFSTAPATSGYTEGQTYYNTTDGKLYRLTGGIWISVSADSSIASGPTTPADGSGTEGDLFYNTTDGKLYRYHSGIWTTSVASTDVTGTFTDSQIADLSAAKLTGTITTTQIADDAISTAKLAAGAITAAKIAADTITATQIAAAAITASEIATDAVIAAKIQAGAITTAKIAAGAVTANEIAANTITAGKIAASTITSTQIAANTITAANIAANTITSNELAANSVTAGKIAAGAVTANALGAGTITVAINLGSSAKIVMDGVNNRIIISD